MQKLIIGFIILFSFYQVSFAQEVKDSIYKLEVNDTITHKDEKSPSVISVLFKGKPGRAFAYSLILPGAGQVYNRSYWKVPIIYAGLGLMVYFIDFNSKQYKRFDNAYHLRVDTENNEPRLEPTDEFKDILSLQGINSYRQYYDKNLQLSYIGIGIIYLLNGIEAFVDRHLQEFDVSKNLSFQYTPNLYTSGGQISMRLNF